MFRSHGSRISDGNSGCLLRIFVILLLLIQAPLSHGAQVHETSNGIAVDCVVNEVEHSSGLQNFTEDHDGHEEERPTPPLSRKRAKAVAAAEAAKQIDSLMHRQLEGYLTKERNAATGDVWVTLSEEGKRKFEADFDSLLDLVSSQGYGIYPSKVIRKMLRGPKGAHPPYPDLIKYVKDHGVKNFDELLARLLKERFLTYGKDKRRSMALRILHAAAHYSHRGGYGGLKLIFGGAVGQVIYSLLYNSGYISALNSFFGGGKRVIADVAAKYTHAPTEESLKAKIAKTSNELLSMQYQFEVDTDLSGDALTRVLTEKKNLWELIEKKYKNEYTQLNKLEAASSSAGSAGASSNSSSSDPESYEKTVDNAVNDYKLAKKALKDKLAKNKFRHFPKQEKDLESAERKLAYHVAYWEYLYVSSSISGTDATKRSVAYQNYISDKVDSLLKMNRFRNFARYMAAIQKIVDAGLTEDDTSKLLQDPEFLKSPGSVADRVPSVRRAEKHHK